MEKDKLLKQLWLACVCGHSPKKICRCINEVGSAEDIYDDNVDKHRLKNVLRSHIGNAENKDLADAENILSECGEKGIRVLSIKDEKYPSLLKNTTYPPNLLYVKGEDIDLNKYLCLAVVGTRKASSDGMEFVNKLCCEIASEGIVVVSGMAVGMDSAAMNGCISAGQITVAVLAGGVDVVYPRGNLELYKKTLAHGVVISERPPGTLGRPEYYQERNRIIAGISRGVLITEGGMHSGVSITAKYAQEYNRDIFAVPGKPSDNKSYIANSLLRDGAVMTLSADDITTEYSALDEYYLENGISALRVTDDAAEYEKDNIYDYDEIKPVRIIKNKNKNKNKKSKEPEIDFEKYEEPEKTILKYLYDKKEPVHIDDIIRDTGLSVSDVNSEMILMQINGLIKQDAGNYYSLA